VEYILILNISYPKEKNIVKILNSLYFYDLKKYSLLPFLWLQIKNYFEIT